MLQDQDLDAKTRLGLRSIKDFAIPLQVTLNGKDFLFWKWYLQPNDQAEDAIKILLGIAEPKPAPVVAPIAQPAPVPKPLEDPAPIPQPTPPPKVEPKMQPKTPSPQRAAPKLSKPEKQIALSPDAKNAYEEIATTGFLKEVLDYFNEKTDSNF